MDVNTAWHEMWDCVEKRDLDGAAEIARNIKRWLSNGGFVPDGHSVRELRSECNAIIDKAG